MASNKICPNKSEHCTEAISRTEFPPEKSHCPECNHELIPIGRDRLIDKIKHFLATVIRRFISFSPAVKYGVLGGVALLLVVSFWVSRRPTPTISTPTGTNNPPKELEKFYRSTDSLLTAIAKSTSFMEAELEKNVDLRDSMLLEEHLQSTLSNIERLRLLLETSLTKDHRKTQEISEKIKVTADNLNLLGTDIRITRKVPYKPETISVFHHNPNGTIEPVINFRTSDGKLLNPKGSKDNIFKHNELRYIFFHTDQSDNATIQPDDKRYNPVVFTQGIGGAIHILNNDRLALGNYTLTIKNKKGKIIHQRKFTIVN